MENITFVTGGTGFVGSYLLRYLVRDGVRVRALKRANSPMDLVADVADKIEWVEGDVLDIGALEVAMQGVSKVYHCAAMISFVPRDREQMFRVNITGTANVVNFCLSLNISKLVHVSSIAALGREANEPYLNESAKWSESPLNPNYGKSKFRAECEVWRGAAEGLDVAIVNPSVILGSGYWSSGSAALFEKVAKGLKFYPSGGTGFVDVRDVAEAMIGLMNSDIVGERFILNAENLSWKAFFEQAASAFGVAPPSRLAKGLPLEIFWRLEALRSRIFGTMPLVTRETIRSSAYTFYYDNSKIQQALGFTFRPLRQTIEATSQQFEVNKTFGRLPL